MENHDPPCKKIKLIEGEEDVPIEEDVVLGEKEDEDPVIIIDDWEEEEEEEEDVVYMGVDQPVHLNNVDADECVEFMMELLHLHDEMELLHILAKAEEEEEEEEVEE
ncbi:hypothetical protein ALC60_03900 [Trachymyrmex zeteki]|uniref:Uncharacterized protein n=1 Tax=Mycetomoellerius zeteki TaxID=64791 RepID=A0A151X9U4_9HYME|nr:hypothetical protein ALC60_03900 [Trachymyrmex zeteki]